MYLLYTSATQSECWMAKGILMVDQVINGVLSVLATHRLIIGFRLGHLLSSKETATIKNSPCDHSLKHCVQIHVKSMHIILHKINKPFISSLGVIFTYLVSLF